MRGIALMTVLALSVIGCNSDDNLVIPDAGVQMDLAVPHPDMASKPDLKTNGPLSCSGVLGCIQTNPMGLAGCVMRATPAAGALLKKLTDCAKTPCLNVDGGTGDCTDLNDNSNACLQCLGGNIQSVCTNELGDCLNDT